MFDRSREWRWRIQLQLTSNSFRVVTNRCHDDKRMCPMNTEALQRNGVPGLRPELRYHEKFQYQDRTILCTPPDRMTAMHSTQADPLQSRSTWPQSFPCRLEPNVNHDSDLYGDPTMPPMTQCFLRFLTPRGSLAQWPRTSHVRLAAM